jgi:hypothetical protein
MAHEPMSPEEYKHHVRDVYKTTVILSIITIVEVAIALIYEFVGIRQHGLPHLPLSIFVITASLVKAYWIMSVFMHIKHEKTAFTMTIMLPFLFLIWAIIAFIWEGHYWNLYHHWFFNI